MNKPYLIQQATFQNKSGKGLDQILKFTYMGNAEFENGVLYKSLQRIRMVDNMLFHLSIGNKIVSIYCNQNDVIVVQKYIHNLASGNYQLKTMSGFDDWVQNKNTWVNADFWWDIENDFMFWKKDVKFDSKFIMAM